MRWIRLMNEQGEVVFVNLAAVASIRFERAVAWDRDAGTAQINWAYPATEYDCAQMDVTNPEIIDYLRAEMEKLAPTEGS